MFASEEAGRTVALGIAISVCSHVFLGWLLVQYVSVDEIRDIELRGVIDDPSDDARVEFVDPEHGNVGERLALENGTAETPGETGGERGAAAPDEGEPAPSDRDTGEATRATPEDEAADPGPEAAPSEHETSTSEAVTDSAPVAGSTPNDGQDDAERHVRSGDEARTPRPSASEAPEEGAREPQDDGDDPERSAKRAEGEPKSGRPTFSSLEGEPSEGDGSDGDGDGGGTLGGVSVSLIEAVFRRNRRELLKCYARHHDYVSNGTESVIAALELGTNGKATQVTTRYRTTNQRVADCMNDRIGEWDFPELQESATFVKKVTIDARVKADWIHPAGPNRLSK